MSVEVVMPQMGESITEGTVSKWLKAVGDKIEKDEAILEISTDKVDAEVPSPSAGTLLEIRHKEGETVEVGTVLAMSGAEGEVTATAPAAETPKPEAARAVVAVEDVPAPAIIADAVAAPAAPSEPAAPGGDATEVVMPQMGESITEGTVSKWLKAVGDDIAKDEPLLEISTDKVDAEVPSPAAGKLLAINVEEGQTVEVGSVLALVGAAGASQVQSPKSEAPSPKAAEVETPKAEAEVPQVKAVAASSNGGDVTVDDLRRTQNSPLVRHIPKERRLDLERSPGARNRGSSPTSAAVWIAASTCVGSRKDPP